MKFLFKLILLLFSVFFVFSVNAKTIKIDGFNKKTKINILNLINKINDFDVKEISIYRKRKIDVYANAKIIKDKCIINISENENKNDNFFNFTILHELGHCYYNFNNNGLIISNSNIFYEDKDKIMDIIKKKNDDLFFQRISIQKHPYVYLNEMAADAYASFWIKKYKFSIDLNKIADIRLKNINEDNNFYYTYDLINLINNNSYDDITKINDLIEENFIRNLYFYE